MPGMVPAMSPWTKEERDRLQFFRWMVVTGKLRDGEDERQLLAEKKLTHRFLPYLRTWSTSIVAAFEDKRS